MTDTLFRTIVWFATARPDPTAQQLTTQYGVHFEEVREMILELEGADPIAADLLEMAQIALARLADYCKTNPGRIFTPSEKRVALLDALCDQIVTIAGVAQAENMALLPALAEVNRSNFSKFDDDGEPILDPVSGKILKGPNYSKPKLEAYASL
jgi:predicted HAD superfamily Cof-like phosphohydrolase